MELVTRGTTPTFTITLPVESSELSAFFLTVRQGSYEIEKTLDDGVLTDDGLVCEITLSQEETLGLTQDSLYHVEIQIRGRTVSGTAFASEVETYRVEEILKDGVI